MDYINLEIAKEAAIIYFEENITADEAIKKVKEKYLDTDQSIQGTNSNEITFKDILPSSVDLDNGEIYDKLTGETIRTL